MFDWRYWRWQVIRNTPLAISVALLVAAFGWATLNAIPLKYTASARIVLERQIGLANTSKAQRTSEEVQHLQAVIHALRASIGDEITDPKSDVDDASFDLKIESSRDKPTYLLVETEMRNAAAATTFAKLLSTRAAEISETTQQRRIDNSLNRLRAKFDASEGLLKQARDALSTHLDRAPMTRIDDLRAQTFQLRAKLHATGSGTFVDNPAVEKLRADLANARSLYSDLHPKVRLIQTRIEHALTQGPSDQSAEAFQIAVQQRLQDLDAQIAASSAHQITTRHLQAEVTSATAIAQTARNTLNAAERAIEASGMHLQTVEDANLTGRSPEKIWAVLFSAILLAALLVSIGAVTVRIRSDRHLRRPRDLHRTLGLTPFAILPDLGPSLG